MTLSSQTRRAPINVRGRSKSKRGRRLTRRQRQRRARRTGALLVVLLVVVGGWWVFMKPSPSPAEAAGVGSEAELGSGGEAPLPEPATSTPAVAERREGEQAPARTIAAAPEEEDDAPVFRMGQPIASSDTPSRASLGEQISRAAQRPEAIEQAAIATPDENADVATRPVFSSPEDVRERIMWGYEAVEQNRLVDARRLFSEALLDERTAPGDRGSLRREITTLNDRLLFSPTIATNDPLVSRYVIEGGDALSRIARKTGAKVDWRFIQRVNQISDPRRIRVGQTLKIVKGPFHAIVDKSDYRMDVFAEVPTSAGGGVVFVRSFPVGLGELDSTPTGEWVVREASKLVNPHWVNPRTGERFDANDPKNPIGERWIGLEGTDPKTTALSGYGIHGTVDPSSIGQQRSMGCVRLLDDDVNLVYELLQEGVSRVAIVE